MTRSTSGGGGKLLLRLLYPVWLFKELAFAAVTLAVDMATPGDTIAPRIVRFPLRVRSDREVAIFAASITITPGTLVLGIHRGEDPYFLVHAVYGRDRASLLRSLKDMENRILRASRGTSAELPEWDPETLGEEFFDEDSAASNLLRQVTHHD